MDEVEWEKLVAPILEEQEKKPQFDIRQYSEKLLLSFNEENEKLSFETVVKGQPRYNICRQFVAALQLVFIIIFFLSNSFVVLLFPKKKKK
jgi:hypothetical protein